MNSGSTAVYNNQKHVLRSMFKSYDTKCTFPLQQYDESEKSRKSTFCRTTGERRVHGKSATTQTYLQALCSVVLLSWRALKNHVGTLTMTIIVCWALRVV